jgi:hypothetical protein
MLMQETPEREKIERVFQPFSELIMRADRRGASFNEVVDTLVSEGFDRQRLLNGEVTFSPVLVGGSVVSVSFSDTIEATFTIFEKLFPGHDPKINQIAKHSLSPRIYNRALVNANSPTFPKWLAIFDLVEGDVKGIETK